MQAPPQVTLAPIASGHAAGPLPCQPIAAPDATAAPDAVPVLEQAGPPGPVLPVLVLPIPTLAAAAQAALPAIHDAAAASLPLAAVPASGPPTMTPPATSAAASVTASAPPATAAAAQVAPVLVQAVHAGGAKHVTVQLNPDELGHVQIRIERGTDGSAAVQVLVERPETLKLLIQDQAQLHRALDSAGLPQDGRSLTMTLNTPDAGNASRQSDAGPPGQGFSRGQPDRRYEPPAQPSRAAWLRAGVDITA